MYKDKIILITGGTGTWGHELTRRLLSDKVKEIRILSRNELLQVSTERYFNDKRVKFIIGDVRDYFSLNTAMKDVDYVFHLAALKHVPICEEQPREAILTNIIGTENLINASIANNVKKVIDVSTDKAVNPCNLYGMTKAVGEKLILQANKLSKDTKFVCVRAGNVIGSNGSVIPLFIDQIKENNRITLTHKNMTRYFITIKEAINLLFKVADISFGGETLVMKMPSFRIIDLAEVLVESYGDKDTKIDIIGLRPGEKLHEELISVHEIPYTYEYTDNYYLIIPTIHIDGLNEHYTNFKDYSKVTFTNFTSENVFTSKEDIKLKLEEAHFL